MSFSQPKAKKRKLSQHDNRKAKKQKTNNQYQPLSRFGFTSIKDNNNNINKSKQHLSSKPITFHAPSHHIDSNNNENDFILKLIEKQEPFYKQKPEYILYEESKLNVDINKIKLYFQNKHSLNHKKNEDNYNNNNNDNDNDNNKENENKDEEYSSHNNEMTELQFDITDTKSFIDKFII